MEQKTELGDSFRTARLWLKLVSVPYQCDQELHLWRTVQELGGPSSYVFTALERIRGQWPYSLGQVMSSVSANDAPVTRDNL